MDYSQSCRIHPAPKDAGILLVLYKRTASQEIGASTVASTCTGVRLLHQHPQIQLKSWRHQHRRSVRTWHEQDALRVQERRREWACRKVACMRIVWCGVQHWSELNGTGRDGTKSIRFNINDEVTLCFWSVWTIIELPAGWHNLEFSWVFPRILTDGTTARLQTLMFQSSGAVPWDFCIWRRENMSTVAVTHFTRQVFSLGFAGSAKWGGYSHFYVLTSYRC